MNTANSDPEKYSLEERLRALAKFAPRFREPNAKIGEWAERTGSGTTEDPYTLPWVMFNDLFREFFEMVYEYDWVNMKFDWPEWTDTGTEIKTRTLTFRITFTKPILSFSHG